METGTVEDSEVSAQRLHGFAERRFGESPSAEWLRYWLGG
jgi:hypothetical protein